MNNGGDLQKVIKHVSNSSDILTKKEKTQYIWGYVLYYSIILAIIPYLLTRRYGFDSLQFYLPIVDLIANLLATTIPIFAKVYVPSPMTITSYISTNFINLVALSGVAWIGSVHAIRTKSVFSGVRLSLIMYAITYLIPTQLIPLILFYHDKMILKEEEINRKVKSEMDIVIGVLLIVIFVLIESFLINYLIGEVGSS